MSPATPAPANSPAALPASAEFDEEAARRLCLLRACEERGHDAALWSPEDAAWAGRLADETAGASATAAAWLAERARHAMQRLLPRRAALARAYGRRIWGARWVVGALLAGLALGALADLIGPGQRINLLAAPVWVVVAWNLFVYAGIALSALRGLRAVRATGVVSRPGPLRRVVLRWLGGAAAKVPFGAAGASHASGTPGKPQVAPERRFAELWARASAPVAASRAALVLHLAAAALAVGLVAGLYARALVLDYRVSWQSTLLEPPQVHAVLAALLAPASAATGIAVPGPQAVAALRVDAAGVRLGVGGEALASTAPWLHLMAATLGLAVIAPRLLLVLRAAWVARRRARRIVLPIADAHTMALLRTRRQAGPGGSGGALGLQVLPHGFTPSPTSTLALHALLAASLGRDVKLSFAPGTAYGEEDRAPPEPPAGTAWRIAWFDLAATPEAQAQGRFVEQLAAASALPLALIVDEAAYRQRMGPASPRVAERRRAWQDFADASGVGLACLDLTTAASEPDKAAATLHAALRPRLPAAR